MSRRNTHTQKGTFKNINRKDKKVDILTKTKHLLTSAALSSFDYNINTSYNITENFFARDIEPVADPFKWIVQSKLIPINDETAEDLRKSRKFVYSHEIKYNKAEDRTFLTLNLIAKTKIGYVPFYVKMEYYNSQKRKANFAFAANLYPILKGKDYLILNRYDEFPFGDHENFYYDIYGNPSTNALTRTNKFGVPHMHFYSFDVLAYLQSQHNKKAKYTKLDAKKSRNYDNLHDMFTFLFNEYNISPINSASLGLTPNTNLLSEIYDECNKNEKHILKQILEYIKKESYQEQISSDIIKSEEFTKKLTSTGENKNLITDVILKHNELTS